jgi:signal transduction histidine kinase
MQQVFRNLLSNAIKYALPDTTVKILEHSEKKLLRFAVINTGIGVPRGWEESIFRPGRRAPNAVATQPLSLGLGLSIAATIVEAHGGELELTNSSDPTIFTVKIPLERS